MILDPTPLLVVLGLLVAASLTGIVPMRRIIRAAEARHELKRGSAGWLRSIGGWVLAAFWAMAVWFLATILGDWAISGDLDGAIARSWLRLQVLLEIAAAISESN